LCSGHQAFLCALPEHWRSHEKYQVTFPSLLQNRIFTTCVIIYYYFAAFSALTLLVGWQEGHLACKKQEWWGAGMDVCLEQGVNLHMAQLMPLPLTVSCFSKIQIGFTFLVPAHPGSPGKGLLNGCVYFAGTVVNRQCFYACCCQQDGHLAVLVIPSFNSEVVFHSG